MYDLNLWFPFKMKSSLFKLFHQVLLQVMETLGKFMSFLLGIRFSKTAYKKSLLDKDLQFYSPFSSIHIEFDPLLRHSPGGSMICHQMNTHLRQGDQNLTRLFWMDILTKVKALHAKLLSVISNRATVYVA